MGKEYKTASMEIGFVDKESGEVKWSPLGNVENVRLKNDVTNTGESGYDKFQSFEWSFTIGDGPLDQENHKRFFASLSETPFWRLYGRPCYFTMFDFSEYNRFSAEA